MKPEQALAWMHDGTERLLADLARLPDAALDGPAALPGWTRRYPVAHVAANAEALRNLVHWARTGEERRMYASPGQRAADIARGAARPTAELRSWVATAARDLAADLAGLPEAAWDAKVITDQGLTRAAREIPPSCSPPGARDPCLLPRRSSARAPLSCSPPGAGDPCLLPRRSSARSSLLRSSVRGQGRALWLAGFLPPLSISSCGGPGASGSPGVPGPPGTPARSGRGSRCAAAARGPGRWKSSRAAAPSPSRG